jgi:hypothetical protein
MSGNSRDGRALSAAEPAESDVEQQDGCGRACARRTPPFRARPYPRFSTEAVHTPARVNVTCVTPLGEEVAST